MKEFMNNPSTNLPVDQPNGYRNYKQNTQYYFVPTYCTYILSTQSIRI